MVAYKFIGAPIIKYKRFDIQDKQKYCNILPRNIEILVHKLANHYCVPVMAHFGSFLHLKAFRQKISSGQSCLKFVLVVVSGSVSE